MSNGPNYLDSIMHWEHRNESTTECGKKAKRVPSTFNMLHVNCPNCKQTPRWKDRKRISDLYQMMKNNMRTEHAVDAMVYLGGKGEEALKTIKDDRVFVTVSSGVHAGNYRSTGEFRIPNGGEYFMTSGGTVRCAVSRRTAPFIIMEKVVERTPLTENDILTWINGHRMTALVIECHACNCDGWIGPVYTRASPNSFIHLLYHEGSTEPLAHIRSGRVEWCEGVEDSVFIHDQELWNEDEIPF